MKVTPTDLFAFGNTAGPKRPKIGRDVLPDAAGMIGPEQPPLPRGSSSFGDVTYAPLKGHYWRLPAGTALPEGLEVVADGREVNRQSTHEPTHHTIYPTVRVQVDQFVQAFLGLPWQYGGRKR